MPYGHGLFCCVISSCLLDVGAWLSLFCSRVHLVRRMWVSKLGFVALGAVGDVVVRLGMRVLPFLVEGLVMWQASSSQSQMQE